VKSDEWRVKGEDFAAPEGGKMFRNVKKRACGGKFFTFRSSLFAKNCNFADDKPKM
jgi:hypothetical protein